MNNYLIVVTKYFLGLLILLLDRAYALDTTDLQLFGRSLPELRSLFATLTMSLVTGKVYNRNYAVHSSLAKLVRRSPKFHLNTTP